jgi:heme exporter protein D
MIGALGDFFAMGGYAQFVWPAYLIAATILAVLTGLSLRDLRREEATLVALRSQRRGGADDGAQG